MGSGSSVFTQTEDLLGVNPGTPYGPDRPVLNFKDAEGDLARLQRAAGIQEAGLARAKAQLHEMQARVSSVYGTAAMQDEDILVLDKNAIPKLKIRIRAMEAQVAAKRAQIEKTVETIRVIGEHNRLNQRQRENIAVAAAMGESLREAGFKIEDIPAILKTMRDAPAPSKAPKRGKAGWPKGKRRRAGGQEQAPRQEEPHEPTP